MIELGYDLKEDSSDYIRSHVLKPETLDDVHLTWYCFQGDLVLKQGEIDLSTNWGWIPVLHIALAMTQIGHQLERSSKERYNFTESEAYLDFRNKSGIVRITSSYAPGHIDIALDQFKSLANENLAKITGELFKRHPGLKQNPVLARYIARKSLELDNSSSIQSNGLTQVKRADIVKRIYNSLNLAGFNRYKGAHVYRDSGLKVSIEIAIQHDKATGTQVDDIIQLGDPKKRSFDSWNFLGLANIAGRSAPYFIPDGQAFEETDLMIDLDGPIPEFFKRINSYTAAYDFFLSDGSTFSGREVRITLDGAISKRDAILEAYGLAEEHKDQARMQIALDALKKYASINAETREDAESFLELNPEFPNIL
jgi:hypothetical protein